MTETSRLRRRLWRNTSGKLRRSGARLWTLPKRLYGTHLPMKCASGSRRLSAATKGAFRRGNGFLPSDPCNRIDPRNPGMGKGHRHENWSLRRLWAGGGDARPPAPWQAENPSEVRVSHDSGVTQKPAMSPCYVRSYPGFAYTSSARADDPASVGPIEIGDQWSGRILYARLRRR
jgi:hypothetical protein